jgi:hypothetical protein
MLSSLRQLGCWAKCLDIDANVGVSLIDDKSSALEKSAQTAKSPQRPKNYARIFREAEAKGYLDVELVYRLRRKESLGSVKQKIVRKIQQNESALCFEALVRELLKAV